MSDVRRQLSRQWIPIVGGSCDLRLGEDAVLSAGKVMRDSVGRPHLCVIVHSTNEERRLVEELQRQAIDAGFSCVLYPVEDKCRTSDCAARLNSAFASYGITADDLCCAVGNADLISVASSVCGSWCQGMSLLGIPRDEVALFEGVLIPRALDVGNSTGVVSVRPAARHALLDLSYVMGSSESEESRHARVLMVGAALSSSEIEFSHLWDNAHLLVNGDAETRRAQIIETAKQRGKLDCSSAMAVRNSLSFGRLFADACATLLPDAGYSSLLAEGMRFCARISVAQDKLPLDDMLALDELLDLMEIETVICDLDERDLMTAYLHQKNLRSRRNLLEIPLAMGRVRLASVENDMLEEHIGAWCDAHRKMCGNEEKYESDYC